jgi:hypothetical protein
VRKNAVVYVPCYRSGAYKNSQWKWGEAFNDFIEMCVDVVETPLMASLPKIYPNPTNVTLHVTGYALQGEADYSIYSVVGQVVQQGKLSCRDAACHVLTINVELLANGLYFMKIDNKVVKIIKK